ncbi:hypothetical protein V2I01_39355 [Micromonospora sp. BRA006-A]|nr:hypothetical protein [Micromonospora sp. BRA006-A]
MQALLALPPSGAIPLTGGYLDPDLQPAAALGAALARAARQPAAWQRGPVEGRADLRAWFAREAGGGLRAEDMVICPGGQAALSSTLRALAVPGDTILVESPTYLGALAAARLPGCGWCPSPPTPTGYAPTSSPPRSPVPAPACSTASPCTPTRTARPCPPPGVARWRRRCARPGRSWSRTTTPATSPSTARLRLHWPPTTRTGTSSTCARSPSTAPGLRIAAIGARGPAGARLRAARLLDDLFVAGPLQQAAV